MYFSYKLYFLKALVIKISKIAKILFYQKIRVTCLKLSADFYYYLFAVENVRSTLDVSHLQQYGALQHF